MYIDRLLFAILLALAALLGAAMLVPEGEAGSGPQGTLLALGWGYGALAILLFVTLIAFGARQKGRLRGLGPRLIAGTVAYLAAWTWLILAYRAYAQSAAPRLVLGLPIPTAIVLWVMWILPLFFSALFVLGFGRWVLSAADLARYRQLLQRRDENSDQHSEDS